LDYKNMVIVNDATSWSVTLESSITLLAPYSQHFHCNLRTSPLG